MNGSRDGFKWALVDLFIALVIGLLAWAWMHVATVQPKPDPTKTNGDLNFQLTWPMANDDDVDLWLKAPGDAPIGYSNMHALHCDLTRDDLGKSSDPESRNLETVYCRGVPAGEYIVNAHLFSNHDGQLPVPVTLEVTAHNHSTAILEQKGVLDHPGDEITIVRFRLDDHGNIVPGIINNLFMPLRAAGSGQS